MTRSIVARAALGALTLLGLAAPAAMATRTGPDYVSSDNLELVDRIKTVGDGVGARLIYPYLYVTTTKSLSIFDIATDPEHPKEVGMETRDVEFENEEVPTNGKLLGISGQIGCPDPSQSNVLGNGNTSLTEATGCLSLYDVSDPSNVKFYKSVAGAGNHTSTCLYDCQWLYGSKGAITDARDPANPKLVGNWQTGLPKNYFKAGCHHLREIQPGLLLGSCQPIILLSTRPEDGGSIMTPVVLDTGTNNDERFIHSGRWPNGGTDKFVLIGGETNGQPVCDDTVGSFMVWDASDVLDGHGGFKTGQQFKLLSEVRPTNGTYSDGHSPYNGLGCSVHWFQEHPTFKNGGLVALAEYENGDRLLQITPEGKIVEQGFFLPLQGSTSAPHWHPNGKVIYSIDYARGVDVLRYTGATYEPDASGTPNTVGTPGTAGASAGGRAAACASAAGFNRASVKGKRRGLRFSVTRRESRRFSVDLYSQTTGRKVRTNRVKRFERRKRSFTWKGSRNLRDGFYYVRFLMRTSNGDVDKRYLTLVRRHGRFRRAPDFRQRTSCGVFSAFYLSSSAFGGSDNRSLRISYRLRRGADKVTIKVLRGKRVIKRFRGGGKANRTYKFRLRARKVRRGARVKVRATVDQGSPVRAPTLTAKRL